MKRSSQVALLLMGTAGLGAGAYAMVPPRKDCIPPGTPPSAVAPAVPGKPALEPCPPRRSGSSGGYYYRSYWGGGNSSHWSRPIFSRSSTTTLATPGSVPLASRGSVPSSSRSGSTSTSRGGFGSTGHAASSSS
jgi:hypothetical protein